MVAPHLQRGQAVERHVPALPAPRSIGVFAPVKVSSCGTKVSVDRPSNGSELRRRVDITDDCRLPLAHDAGLLQRDLAEGVSKPVAVIQRHIGNDATVVIDRIDRIQAPSEANLEQRCVDLALGEDAHGSQRAVFEVSQWNRAAHRLDAAEGVDDRRFTGHQPVDANSFLIAQNMR